MNAFIPQNESARQLTDVEVVKPQEPSNSSWWQQKVLMGNDRGAQTDFCWQLANHLKECRLMTSDVSLKLSCSLLLERLSAWLSAMKRLSKCRRHAQPEFEIDESRGRIVDLAFHDIKLYMSKETTKKRSCYCINSRLFQTWSLEHRDHIYEYDPVMWWIQYVISKAEW